jgi:hypothetical protein
MNAAGASQGFALVLHGFWKERFGGGSLAVSACQEDEDFA